MRLWQMACLTMSLAACSYADIITFTQTGVGSGTIGATTFTNAAFTITDIGNTANRTAVPLGFFIDDTSASILINGVGTFGFLTGTRTFVNNSVGNGTVGFSRAGTAGDDLFDGPSNAVFGTWDMLSSIGPISGTGFLQQWDPAAFGAVNTTGGVLIFQSGSSSTVFNGTTGTVPEPSTLPVLTGCLIGLVVGFRRILLSEHTPPR
jgi:hypothetical protein